MVWRHTWLWGRSTALGEVLVQLAHSNYSSELDCTTNKDHKAQIQISWRVQFAPSLGPVAVYWGVAVL